VTGHFPRALFGDSRVSQAFPIEWIRALLQQHSPQCGDKYLYLDQGGDLYANPTVRELSPSDLLMRQLHPSQLKLLTAYTILPLDPKEGTFDHASTSLILLPFTAW
jgi:hypothetical protein